MDESKLNKTLVEAIKQYSPPWPQFISNGFFIRATLLNTFLGTGGYSYPKDDLLAESQMNEKEFDRILAEFIEKKYIATEKDPLNEKQILYKLQLEKKE